LLRISRRRVGAFARAIGAKNPAYYDPYDAGYLGFRDVIAPPLFAYALTQANVEDIFTDLGFEGIFRPLPIGQPVPKSAVQPRKSGGKQELRAWPEAEPRRAASGTAANGTAHNETLALLHSLHLTAQQPIIAGSSLDVETTAQHRKSGPWTVITCESELKDGSETVAELKAVYGLGKATVPQTPENAPNEKEHEGAALEIEITQDEIAKFCAASGDYNPIHLDKAAAQQFGFPNVIAPGLLLLGKAMSQLELELEQPKTIVARLLNPIVVPETGAKITATVTTSKKTDLTFTQSNKRVARATLSQ
jgi:acyl dehydratase